MISQLVEIQQHLKENFGIFRMKTVIEEGDYKTEKFLNLFGFLSDGTLVRLEDGREIIIMTLEF